MNEGNAKQVEDIEVWWKRIGCIREPSYSTGEQGAMQAEIDELRAALATPASLPVAGALDAEQVQLDEFILRAGFTYGWRELESWARRMAEQAVSELNALRQPLLVVGASAVEREMFETWGNSKYAPYPVAPREESREGEGYLTIADGSAWAAWQARAQRAGTAEADLKELTTLYEGYNDVLLATDARAMREMTRAEKAEAELSAEKLEHEVTRTAVKCHQRAGAMKSAHIAKLEAKLQQAQPPQVEQVVDWRALVVEMVHMMGLGTETGIDGAWFHEAVCAITAPPKGSK